MPDGPSFRRGVRAGDEVVEVDGADVTRLDVAALGRACYGVPRLSVWQVLRRPPPSPSSTRSAPRCVASCSLPGPWFGSGEESATPGSVGGEESERNSVGIYDMRCTGGAGLGRGWVTERESLCRGARWGAASARQYHAVAVGSRAVRRRDRLRRPAARDGGAAAAACLRVPAAPAGAAQRARFAVRAVRGAAGVHRRRRGPDAAAHRPPAARRLAPGPAGPARRRRRRPRGRRRRADKEGRHRRAKVRRAVSAPRLPPVLCSQLLRSYEGGAHMGR
jgi:hypothetical protein